MDFLLWIITSLRSSSLNGFWLLSTFWRHYWLNQTSLFSFFSHTWWIPSLIFQLFLLHLSSTFYTFWQSPLHNLKIYCLYILASSSNFSNSRKFFSPYVFTFALIRSVMICIIEHAKEWSVPQSTTYDPNARPLEEPTLWH